jgi:hypothetical protein
MPLFLPLQLGEPDIPFTLFLGCYYYLPPLVPGLLLLSFSLVLWAATDIFLSLSLDFFCYLPEVLLLVFLF